MSESKEINFNVPQVDLGSIGSEEFQDPFGDMKGSITFESVDEADDEEASSNNPTENSEADAEPAPKQSSENSTFNFFDNSDLKEEITPEKQKTVIPLSKGAETAKNPFEMAMKESEHEALKMTYQSVFEKPAQFQYAGIEEDIEDLSITFEQLRKDKKDDFPELQDAGKVKWKVEYGTVTENITTPGKKPIQEVKTAIEDSEKFIEGLKKAKKPEDKNPICKIKPAVEAQKKGTLAVSYKGVFPTVVEAENANKLISIVPGRDGKVYEIRKNSIGTFTTAHTRQDKMLSDIKAGFNPALPKISREMVIEIVQAFKTHYQKNKAECMFNIYWDTCENKFILDYPKQSTSCCSITAQPTELYQDDQYLHYIDIHSHHVMRAFFSSIDDEDEKATRVYAVVGRIDKKMPDIKVRISNGGVFHEINPRLIFDLPQQAVEEEVKYERELYEKKIKKWYEKISDYFF